MSSRDEYVAVIKQAFVTLGKKAAMDFIVAKIPALAAKGIFGTLANPIVAHFVGMAVEGIATQAETAAFFLYTDMRVGAQGKAFEAAAYANYKAQKGTPQEKANAEKILRSELRKFITLTN